MTAIKISDVDTVALRTHAERLGISVEQLVKNILISELEGDHPNLACLAHKAEIVVIDDVTSS